MNDDQTGLTKAQKKAVTLICVKTSFLVMMMVYGIVTAHEWLPVWVEFAGLVVDELANP